MPGSTPIVRFAPSPTGTLHIGSARTALFNYLFARQTGGTFIVRIEDTDRARSKREFEDDIFAGLHWLGMDCDETYRQSQRGDIYSGYIDQLLKTNAAYVSEESEGENKTVIRFRNPNTTITFHDIVRGEITFDTSELGDFVIAKGHASPLYHLAVVIDDHESKITHIIRGEDHISNTPRQILIQEAIGAKRPEYAHMPLILAPDRSKLSKRHGATAVTDLKEEGYLSDAMFNFIALLGWHPEGDQEIMSREELINTFDLQNLQKGGAILDRAKLRWLNREYIRQLSEAELEAMTLKFLPTELANTVALHAQKNLIIRTFTERIETFGDLKTYHDTGEYAFIQGPDEYTAVKLLWKDTDHPTTAAHLAAVKALLEEAPKDTWATAESLKDTIWPYAEKAGRGAVLWPLRMALSGREKSPDPFTIAAIVGKEDTLARIGKAIEMLH